MGERKHKAEAGEKKDKVGQGNKASAQVSHPVLQLQQLVGNRAVTNLIQRHGPHPTSESRQVDYRIDQIEHGVSFNMETTNRIRQILSHHELLPDHRAGHREMWARDRERYGGGEQE